MIRAPDVPNGLVWFNSAPMRLADLRGKVVLLEFWTFCCVNCHHNIAQLHALMDRYGDALVVIGVHSAKFPAEYAATNVRAAVLRHAIRYPVVSDERLAVWGNYAVRAWPTLVVIDPNGRIADTHLGEFRADDLAPTIDALLVAAEGAGTLDRRPLTHAPEREYEPDTLLRYPSRLALGPDGTLFVADTGHHRVLEIALDAATTRGTVRRAWGAGDPALRDGRGTDAAFHHPRGFQVLDDALVVADTDNHAIRRIDLHDGTVRTIAGDGTKAHGRMVAAEPTQTPLRSPWAVAVQGDDVLIAMAGAHQVWRLHDGRLDLVAGTGYESLEDGVLHEAGFSQPSDIVWHDAQGYVVDAETSAVRAIDLRSGTVTTLVGRGLFTFGDQDGVGDDVRLQHPTGLALHDGLLYIADTFNNAIKRLDPHTRRVERIVGAGVAGDADGPCATATLNEPEGIVVRDGVLFIADTNNHRIRIADLARDEVRTLIIDDPRGVLVPRRRAIRLPAVRVAAGTVTLRFDVRIGAGYKPNPDAPLVLRADGDTPRTFGATEQPALTIDVSHDYDLALDLTAYPCSIADGLCLLHDARLVVPLVVVGDGNSSAVVRYDVG